MAKEVEEAQVVEETVDAAQEIEQDAYVPTYTVKPELKQAVLQAIGDRPFNEIAGLINAINVPTMDHNTLTQVINVIGQFPYVRVEKLLENINSYVEQVIED
jgi:hypothetical protein